MISHVVILPIGVFRQIKGAKSFKRKFILCSQELRKNIEINDVNYTNAFLFRNYKKKLGLKFSCS